MDLTIDCRDGLAAIHEQLAAELAFPQWYGKNLDALHDCLTDLSQHVTFTLHYPELLPGLVRVLTGSAAENPNLTVILAQ